MAEGLKYWYGRPQKISQILVWQNVADGSGYLKYWYGSCHTLPLGSAVPDEIHMNVLKSLLVSMYLIIYFKDLAFRHFIMGG